MENNPVGLDGVEFIEFASDQPGYYEGLFSQFGFEKMGKHKSKEVFFYRQGDINFIANYETGGSFAEDFQKSHGPSICATGFRVKNAKEAFDVAVERGAKPYEGESKYPAIYGIGDSLVYFIEKYDDKGNIYDDDFALDKSFSEAQ